MLTSHQNNLLFLDCSLRDGGYYTNWDFEESLVNEYFEAMNHLPVDYIEIGYRSKTGKEYAGAFYYLPLFVLEACKNKTSKKIAIILNEKEVEKKDLSELLDSCVGIVSMVRLAVQPKNLERATELSEEIKKKGFEVAFNLMYASTWEKDFPLPGTLEKLNKILDYFYVVDSFGGLYPKEVKKIFSYLSKHLNVKLGFHGHNNLEMALVNSLTAIDAGADIIDSTICGMGRGAGNLKTELLFTVLHQKDKLEVNFDFLNAVTSSFEELKNKYHWGGNLSYMVSGAFSLPQNTVLSQVKKRYCSLNSIVEKETLQDNITIKPEKYRHFQFSEKVKEVLLVGGGNSSKGFAKALQLYLKANPETAIIFASSKNVPVFKGLQNLQIHCLPGMEARRLEKIIIKDTAENHLYLLPSEHSNLSNYLPQEWKEKTYVVEDTYFKNNKNEISSTSMGITIAKILKAQTIYLTGYDGYGEDVNSQELELFDENQAIFDKLVREGKLTLSAVTPTGYNIPSQSIFALVKCL